jgi:transcriptional regulator with XRE-family HTH domain
MRRETPKMRWFDRVAAALAEKGVSAAAVGCELGISGQAAGMKLRGKRGVSVEELKIMAKLAGLTVAEAVGDDVVLIELQDERDLIELYRLLTPEQRKLLLGMAGQMVGQQK